MHETLKKHILYHQHKQNLTLSFCCWAFNFFSLLKRVLPLLLKFEVSEYIFPAIKILCFKLARSSRTALHTTYHYLLSGAFNIITLDPEQLKKLSEYYCNLFNFSFKSVTFTECEKSLFVRPMLKIFSNPDILNPYRPL